MTLLRRAFLLLATVVAALAATSIAVQLAYQAEAQARIDETLAALRAGDGRSLPVPLHVSTDDSLDAVMPRTRAGQEAARAAAIDAFGAALRAGPYRAERPGTWSTAINRLFHLLDPLETEPVVTWVELADGRYFALFAMRHEGRWSLMAGRASVSTMTSTGRRPHRRDTAVVSRKQGA